VPDATLPVNSQVTLEGNTFTLKGGTAAGSNLFQSFSELLLPAGWEAFFNNAANIDNIFTRVMAASQSFGDAGNVTISAIDHVEVTHGEEISVRGLSSGKPGNLTVSGSILLDRQGSL
jgi:large exoprotein involved in heme utilization and adhesion